MGSIEFILFIFAVFLMFFFLLYVGKKLAGLISHNSFAIKRWIRLTTHSRRFYVIVMTCLLFATPLINVYAQEAGTSTEEKTTPPTENTIMNFGGTMYLDGAGDCTTEEIIAEYPWTNLDDAQPVGNTASSQKGRQSFISTGNCSLKHINIKMARNSGAGDSVLLKIYDDATGSNLLATSESISYADIAVYGGIETLEEEEFTFTESINLTQDEDYSFEISRTGSLSDDKYLVGIDSSSPSYTDGTFYAFNGSSWSDISADAEFEVWGDVPAGEAPTPEFSGTPTSGTAPLSVEFTDESTGTPTSWFWDFGDDEFGTDQNPTHVYSTSGTYNVAMGATNAYGTATSTKNSYITVGEAFEFTGVVANLSNFLDNGNFLKTIIWFCAGLLLTAFLIAFSLIFKAFRDIM